MHHTVDFLATTVRNILSTLVLSFLNENNPRSNNANWTRTYDLRVYPGTTDIKPQIILENSQVVVGMIDGDGNLYVCVDECVLGIAMHPVAFDDKNGYWSLNLWYSIIWIGEHVEKISNREELMSKYQDFFMFLNPIQNPGSSIGTIICKSWRVRYESGEIILPQPQRDILTTM